MNAVNSNMMPIEVTGALLVERKVVRGYKPNKGANQNQQNDQGAMSDEFIQDKAARDAINEYSKKPMRKLERAFVLGVVPLAASIHDGVFSGAKTAAEKSTKTLKSAGRYGVMIAGVLGGYELLNKATKKNAFFSDVRKENPVLSAFGLVAGAVGIGLGADKVGGKIASVKTASGKTYGTKLQSKVTKKLDNSKNLMASLDKHVFKPAEKFMTENPVGKNLKKFGGALLLAGVGVKFLVDYSAVSKNKQLNEQKLINQKEKQIVKNPQNPFVSTQEGNVKYIERNRVVFVPEEMREEVISNIFKEQNKQG